MSPGSGVPGQPGCGLRARAGLRRARPAGQNQRLAVITMATTVAAAMVRKPFAIHWAAFTVSADEDGAV